MRIVGGEFRGRSLAVPKSNAIRPTADRTRESLFNILSHAYPEAIDATRMMDLFAGTGAVGLEGASRGCRHVLFVESSVEGRGLLWENIDALGLHGRTRMLRRDATDLGSVGNLEPFDFLFADPPYGHGLGEKAFAAAADGGWLVPGALAILEERADIVVNVPPAYMLLEVRTFGDSKMHFFRYQPV
ncbi:MULTISPECIES: 16S rRNA (guanine(966)-N(2))-methyltransferase RsmD [unclassified Rhizobium]|uniref:16S rRNA (guanine(966)-N(2))-methyltransferase RsmD n=1 Tax=unclassified Rhizobium TaxID=2613769 RepID=UPI001ADD074D|nr:MULTISPECIES: 16S rRNA (guanine(966)-N(2))-methyltransferase RsmD [unclassified Rhizobium]MBO9097405.1 16S rRNA (guanine(966)-N(2))-methyltransferase RsmD [Rhizobium sp. L58/93]MBO9167644.1 16S rRNA (guanine(966)-N(2))-methyltransferase RsmD [Rhizobium sp. L245/93]MBO9183603.1 16S rRNA (guanine(966)-N(2))-methyltransferase RsmD [Rhizobium sp. E27B/91]MBO9133743.1 16S rRNA (guanine(966)-N(2))-methyltransferase RsmD [Rhizobium sp. B209b/85]QXZ83926.1 16S rRNA (guanine(966)-N(2))-methyltransfe